MTNFNERLDEILKTSHHRIRTRILRDAEIYQSHIAQSEYEAKQAIIKLIEDEAKSEDLDPDKMLLAENKRLIEAGDKLYEAASYTGREFDGTHRLLSAAAHWLDTRGKNSGQYQAEQNLLKQLEEV